MFVLISRKNLTVKEKSVWSVKICVTAVFYVYKKIALYMSLNIIMSFDGDYVNF